MKRYAVAKIAAAWILVCLAFGCGDGNVFEGSSSDSSASSRLERGVAALNEEAWDEAVAIFEGLDQNDPEVRKYLASAYVGRAGFDTLTLVDLVVTAGDSGSGGSVLYDAVTKIFAAKDGDGTVSSEDLVAKKDDLALAVAVLAPTGRTTGEDASETFQAAMYAGMHTVVLAAELLGSTDASREGVSTMSDEEIDSRVTQERFEALKPEFEQDLWLVVDGVAVATNNEVGEDWDRFLSEIGFDDGQLAADDLRTFFKDL